MTAWLELHRASHSAAGFIASKPLLGDHGLLILISLVLGAVAARFLWRRRTLKWPITMGTIESVNVSTIRSWRWGTRELSTAEIAYSYSVEGQFYSGYWKRTFTDEQEAWDFVGPLEGREVRVHYQPGRPEKSALAG